MAASDRVRSGNGAAGGGPQRRAATPGGAGYRPPARPGRPPQPPPRRPDTLGMRWRRFVRKHGWRAYALPVLVVLTVLALVTTNSPKVVKQALSGAAGSTSGNGGHGSNAGQAGPPNAATNGKLKSDTPGNSAQTTVLPSLQLPPGPAYTTTGAGTYATIPGTSAVIGTGTVHKFSIEVENGITGVDLGAFASTVMTALSNPQSWIADRKTALQRVDSGPVEFHVTLVSSMTVRQLCGYDLPVETSCYAQGAGNRVVLNVARWMRGAKAYSSDLATYRLYAVNHEVGHALGHMHAHECLASGIAPVMMQQTIGTTTASGRICQPNPWPYPTGVKDAPGAEQAGDGPDLTFYQRNAH